MPAAKMRLRFPALYPNTFVRFFVKARDRFAGSRCPEMQMTFARLTTSRSRLFPDDRTLNRWLRLARDRVQFPGIAGAHLLARLWRTR